MGMFEPILEFFRSGTPKNNQSARIVTKRAASAPASSPARTNGAVRPVQALKENNANGNQPEVVRPTPDERPAPRATITSFEEIPEFTDLLTATGSKLQISPEMQEKMAAILVKPGKCILLADPETWNTNQHRTLKKRVADAYGFGGIQAEQKIEKSALRLLYAHFDDNREAQATNTNKEDSKYAGMIDDMLVAAVNLRATDVHMLARNEDKRTGTILFRIDGILRVWQQSPYVDMLGMSGFMYTWMAEESSRGDPSYNPRAMQSCAIKTLVGETEYKIRYQSVRANGGFDVILRLLPINKEDVQTTLNMLGYESSQCMSLDVASRKTVGAIVVAGVTGSGKSTTLKTLMTMSPRRAQHKSYSIEDPVEYRIPGVTQINVQRSTADTGKDSVNPFLQAMRVIMRADPDTIMVGEVRDTESCSMLQTMVQSGHQVMTTVHASSVIEILDRMSSDEMGLSRHTMSSKNFLSALVYQRLLPKICPDCRKPAEGVIPEDRLEIVRKKFGLDTSRMFAAIDNENGEHGPKCQKCKGYGVQGQTVAAEIILPSLEFLKLVREGKDSEAEEYWRMTRTSAFSHPDMTGKTAFEHGLYKVSVGMVDLRHLEDNFSPMESYDIVFIQKEKEVTS